MISHVITNLLRADSEISGIVQYQDSQGKTRYAIHNTVIPQSVKNPAIRVFVANDAPLEEKDKGFAWNVYTAQVDVYADSYKQAQILGKATLRVLHFRTGEYSGYNIINLIYKGYTEDYEDEVNSYRHILKFQITIQ